MPSLNDEMLQYALANGIIDLDAMREKVGAMQKQEILEQHTFRIWKGTYGHWYTYIPDSDAKGGRRLVHKRKREDIDEAIIQAYYTELQEPYIEEVFREWVDRKLEYGEIKKQSYDRYVRVYERFFRPHKIGSLRMPYVTEEILEEFIKSSIHDQQLTAKAWGNLRVVIYGIFRHAKKKGYTKMSITNFMGDLELSRKAFKRNVKTSETEVFTDEEYELIRNYIETKEPTVINYGIILAFQTGVRAGELAALKWEDVHDGFLSINKTEIYYRDENNKNKFAVAETKTEAGAREIILTQNAQRTLKKVRLQNPFGEWIFVKSNGERVREKLFGTHLKKICQEVGIPPRSMHKARKTYATKLIHAGVSEALVIDQMGHTDISTTKQFYYYNNHGRDYARNSIQSAIDF